MNDQDIIHKAAELADGWQITTWSGNPIVHCPIEDVDGFHIDYLPAVFLDALAAQLVRQVDALDPLYTVIIYEETTVVAFDATERRSSGYNQNDRTMNTLRVIVESGVLDE